MNKLITITCLSAILTALSLGQVSRSKPNGTGQASVDLLDQEVPHYEVTAGSFIEALSELSRTSSVPLHLGIEEEVRQRMIDPEDHSVQFSLRLERATVRGILNAICNSDRRYAWSTDGDSVNFYPVSRAGDSSDLLNLRIGRIELKNVPDPDQALTPLSKLFPDESVGYMQAGGDPSYAEPWTITLEHLTVREFADRIAEHMGPRTTWIWQGGRDSRLFTFIKGGFH